MIPTYKLSCYTYTHQLENGDLILHNSFMGSLARVPQQQLPAIEPYLNREISFPMDDENDLLKELCKNRFFIESDSDEQSEIDEILSYERDMHTMHLIVLPHEQCNFRCSYCYESFENGKITPLVVSAIKRYVREQMPRFKMLKVYWFGGEPLLASDVITGLSEFFIDYCEQNEKRYGAFITTNGYLLNPSLAAKLLSLSITNYQITIDGPETLHNANRRLAGGGKTYKRILQNVLSFKEQPYDFRVSIRVNFEPLHMPEISHWVENEIAPAFVNDERFSLNYNLIENWDNVSIYDSSSLDAFPLKLNLIGTTYNSPITRTCVHDYLMPNTSVCYAAKKSSLIFGADGSLYKCTVAFKDPSNQVGYVDQAGNLVFDQDKLNLWIDTAHLDCSRCTKCSFYPSCQSRKCPKIGIETGKPVCPFSVSEYHHLLELAASEH